MINFIKFSSGREASDYLAGVLKRKLSKRQKVLWLVPGGSSIHIAVEASRQLPQDTANLVIGQTDERYGPIGHKDSNWRQLTEAGFAAGNAKTMVVLGGQDLNKTATDYSAMLGRVVKETNYRLGLFGIGADGHTAGIKPDSPSVDSANLYEGYTWDDFTRLTLTPKAIGLLDEVVVYAAGDDKRPQMELLAKTLPIEKQPAQALKQVSKLTVFNDQIGEKE